MTMVCPFAPTTDMPTTGLLLNEASAEPRISGASKSSTEDVDAITPAPKSSSSESTNNIGANGTTNSADPTPPRANVAPPDATVPGPITNVLAIGRPLQFPCGLRTRNRLVKTSLSERLCGWNHLPTEQHTNIYENWAKGQWGMMISGAVCVDRQYLFNSGDLAIDRTLVIDDTETRWKDLAEVCKQHHAPMILQLSHPGKLSPWRAGDRGLFSMNVAPSTRPVNLGFRPLAVAASALVFGMPFKMTDDDVQDLVGRYVYAAQKASEWGFSGVEISAAYDNLLAQFLSAEHNVRTDHYGNTHRHRAEVLYQIIHQIRSIVPFDFCVGVKISVPREKSYGERLVVVEQLKRVVEVGVDFVEICGGNYPHSAAQMLKPHEEGAHFYQMVKETREAFPRLHLIATGGFRSRCEMESAVDGQECAMVGVGRPAALQPRLPIEVLLEPGVSNNDARVKECPRMRRRCEKWTGLYKVGLSAENAWYSRKVQKLAKRNLLDPTWK